MKPGNLNFLEPSGLLQACNGTALLLHYELSKKKCLYLLLNLYKHKTSKRVHKYGSQNVMVHIANIYKMMVFFTFVVFKKKFLPLGYENWILTLKE